MKLTLVVALALALTLASAKPVTFKFADHFYFFWKLFLQTEEVTNAKVSPHLKEAFVKLSKEVYQQKHKQDEGILQEF